MNRVEQVIEDFLAHRSEYDPAKAREYYLRTRKLKGRKPGAKVPTAKTTLNEDEIPEKSPSGAKIVDFDGKNGGRATYSDGSVLTGAGWSKTNKAGVSRARATNANVRKQSSESSRRRIGQAEQKLIRAKTQANEIKNPTEKKRTLDFLNQLEDRLKQVKLNTRDQRQIK